MTARNASFQGRSFVQRLTDSISTSSTQQLFVGAILFLALLAFEVFNFDTTRYALNNLLGQQEFVGITWAAILAVAFCAIDFAGLSRMFTPETGKDEPTAVRYLTGAWFLGATMNAMMTWWAVSLTLLNHPLGNEVLSREQLLLYVPIFVAVLVWVTRILFIGSIAVAGDQLINGNRKPSSRSNSSSKSHNQYNNNRTTRAARPAPKTRTTRTAGANFSGSTRSEPVSFSPSSTTRMEPVRTATPLKGPSMPSSSNTHHNGGGRSSRISRVPSSGSRTNRPPVMRAKGRR